MIGIHDNAHSVSKPQEFLRFLALAQTLVAIAISLFFSEVMKLPPCSLCWYQRMAMFPLGLILTISVVKRDDAATVYGLPLALLGLCVSVYHNLLYYKIIPDSLVPCTAGVSCTTKQIEWLGFISIPFLSLLSFAFIVGLLLLSEKFSKTE